MSKLNTEQEMIDMAYIDSFNKRIQELKESIKNLETKNSQYEHQINKLKQDLNNSNNKINSLETKIKNVENDYKVEKNKIKENQTLIQNTANKVNSKIDNFDNKIKNINVIENKMKEIETKISNNSSNNKKLNSLDTEELINNSLLMLKDRRVLNEKLEQIEFQLKNIDKKILQNPKIINLIEVF